MYLFFMDFIGWKIKNLFIKCTVHDYSKYYWGVFMAGHYEKFPVCSKCGRYKPL